MVTGDRESARQEAHLVRREVCEEVAGDANLPRRLPVRLGHAAETSEKRGVEREEVVNGFRNRKRGW